MKIGIDCRTMLNPVLGERAGVGHYTKELVDHIIPLLTEEDTLVLFFDQRMPDEVLAMYAAQPRVRTKRFPWGEYKKYLPFGYSHVVVARSLAAEKLDVFHAPAYIIPYQYKGRSVVTIHDLAIYTHPEWFPPKQSFSIDVLVPSSIKKSQQVIAVSEATAKSIEKQFHTSSDRVNVIYEGVNPVPKVSAAAAKKIRAEKQVGKRYFFFVGTIEPRKNIEGLVKAFDQALKTLGKRSHDIQLVIAGGKGWKHESIFRTIARSHFSSNIRYVGYISAEEKAALLKGALAFVFPSFWEGFGLPVIEAESVGVPVITSSTSSLPEVGGKAVMSVDPKNVSSIAKAMVSIVRSPAKRKTMIAAGKKQAKQFTWKKCAQQTYALYKKVYDTK